MKKHIILASVLLLAAATSLAQNPTTEGKQEDASPKTSSIATMRKSDSVVMQSNKGADNLMSAISELQRIPDDYETTLSISLAAKPKTDQAVSDSTMGCEATINPTIGSVTGHFYWGFHNWGNNMWNGLAGMTGANDLRTSFSNYQLELHGNLHLSKRWILSVGVAWESDCYKFDHNYVGLNVDANSGSGNFFVGTMDDVVANELLGGDPTSISNWETRLVARYINIPISLCYNFKVADIGLALSVIPGFNYNGKRTGMRYYMETTGKAYLRIDNDVEDFLNPFKCDLRLEVQTDFVGIFVQVPTMPVMQNMGEKFYPFKIGFFL